MGEDGWLGLGWPVEYGGQARGPIDQMIFVEESHWAGVPLPLLTLNSVGPTLMALGTEEQKQRILPGILRGEVHFSIGYTEPTAGTDLASLQTRAVRDGDEYVITGEKLYTSAIQYADYVWLAARTDPDAPKHKGLSVFIVPTDAPGFHWTPLRTMAGEFTSSTFYDEVRVPAGQPGGRGEPGVEADHQPAQPRAGGHLPGVGDPAQHRRGPAVGPGDDELADGRRVIDQQWVQIHLARVQAKAEFLKLLNWKVAWASDKGLNPADASATKVFGTEFALEAYRLLLEIVGQAGYLARGLARERSCRAGSSTTPGARPSSPSAAGPTRSSATSSPWSAWACPGHPVDQPVVRHRVRTASSHDYRMAGLPDEADYRMERTTG